MNPEKQVAIVTGAARGIGRQVAARLHSRGDQVVLWDQDVDAVRKAVEALPASRYAAVAMQVDVTDAATVQRAMREVVESMGGLSILVNNAGMYPHIQIDDMSLSQWRRVISVNLEGAFLCTQAALPFMKQGQYGRIVNFSSAVVYTGLTGVSAYAASKAAVQGLTRVTATEAGACGITANAVAPGLIETEGVMSQIAEHFDDILPMQVVKRRGMPDDIAECVAYLASAEAGFVTGQTFCVNGGIHYT